MLWGHKHYRVPHLCPFRHRLVAVSSLHFFLSLPITVLLPGCFWAQDTLRDSSWLLDGEGFFLPPVCFHTCLLVCSQLVSLFLYLHCDSSLWVLSVKGISLSPVPHFSLHCSVFFVLMALGTGLKSHLFSYSSLYFTLTCGCSLWVLPGHSSLSSVCLRACPPCSLQLMPLLLSLSLSLLLFFSLGAYLDT